MKKLLLFLGIIGVTVGSFLILKKQFKKPPIEPSPDDEQPTEKQDENEINKNDLTPFTAIVNTVLDPLNVREKPFSNASVIAKANKNQVVTVSAESGDFYYIKYGSVTGWASKSYLKKYDVPEPKTGFPNVTINAFSISDWKKTAIGSVTYTNTKLNKDAETLYEILKKSDSTDDESVMGVLKTYKSKQQISQLCNAYYNKYKEDLKTKLTQGWHEVWTDVYNYVSKLPNYTK